MTSVVPVLTAATGQPWEAGLVARSGAAEVGVEVVARCLDVVDLLATAHAGRARVAVVAADLRHLDRETVARLHELGLSVVLVGSPGRLEEVGVDAVVDEAAPPELIGRAVAEALAPARPTLEMAGPRGHLVAVWGPTGAPGRSTVALALADEAADAGVRTVLVDADAYGGSIATQLGLLDEAPGLAAAVRAAATGMLDPSALLACCCAIEASPLAVLTGITRADRWPELRDAAFAAVLEAARHTADLVVVDVGFCLEADEEITYDLPAPRRNGATLTALAAADTVVAVAAADPLGLQRFVRALPDLRAGLRADARVSIVVNKVRDGAVGGRDAAAQITAALERHAKTAPDALLPHDLVACDRSLARGSTLREVARSSALRAGLRALAGELAGAPVTSRRPRRRARRRAR